jgi:tetratricopeptide (TPR) repeat protein
LSANCRLSNLLHQNDKVLKHAGQWVKLDPQSYEARQYLRLAYLNSGKQAEADAEAKLLAKLTPSHAPAYFMMGNALIQGQRFDEAIDLLRRGLKDFPEHKGIAGLLHLTEGIKLMLSKQFVQAVEPLKQSAAEFPLIYDARVYLSICYEKLGKIPEASEQAKKVLPMVAQIPNLRQRAAAFFMRNQRYDDAIDAYKQAVKKHPRDLTLRQELVRFYVVAKRSGEAESVLADIPGETAEDWMLRIRAAAYVADQQARVDKAPPEKKLARLKALIAEGRAQAGKSKELDTAVFDALESWVTSPQQWLVVGPFPGGPNFKGFDAEFPPEKTVDPKAEYQGAKGVIRWQPTSVLAGEYVDLVALCGQTPHVVAYALTYLHSPKGQEVTLRVGSDDGVKVWLNDKPVLVRRVYRSFRDAEDTVRVTVRPGPNKLLLKIDQGAEDWGFALDAVDSGGWPAVLSWRTASPSKDGR